MRALMASPNLTAMRTASRVEHRQHARIGRDRPGWPGRWAGRRSAVGRAGEDLRVRRELRVDLEPDDDFPVAHHSYPRGRARVPVGGALEAMRGAQQRASAKCGPMSCSPTGRSVDEAAGHRHAGQPGEIRADGVDVVQVHRDRIVGLRAEVEGRRSAWSGPMSTSTFSKARAKSSLISARTCCAFR